MQLYHSASIKSEQTIAEKKQRINLTVNTLNSLHLSDFLDSAHFRQNTQVVAQPSDGAQIRQFILQRRHTIFSGILVSLQFRESTP